MFHFDLIPPRNGEVSIALKIELAHFTRSSAWCQEATKRAGVEFAEVRSEVEKQVSTTNFATAVVSRFN